MSAPTISSPSRPSSIDDSHFDRTIEAGRAEKHYWLDLWLYRELFLILTWRDVSVRYKQTVIGAAWAIIQPLLTMIVMTIVFSRVAGLHSDGSSPYAIMVLAGMLPWTFFSTALAAASQSMVTNANLVSKVYFPRLIVPASSIATCLVDFAVSFLVVIALMVWYRFSPSWNFLALPVFVVITFLAALGPGLFITALNVKYRDFRYVIPFIIQFGLYVTPVGFSSTVVRQKLGENLFLLYSVNPMVGIIDLFRWCILGNNAPIDIGALCVSLLVVIVSLILGIWYFRKTEKGFADII